MTRSNVWMGRGGGWVGAFVVLGVSAGDVHCQAPAAGAVQDLLSYHLNGSGHWRQENPDFEPGGDAPAYWVRSLARGPGPDVVITDAFAVYEGGRCESVAHMVYYWDTENARVALRSFNAGGVTAEGYLEGHGPSETRFLISVRLPDGSELRLRDISDRTSPEAYTTRAERWTEGEWVAGDSVIWRHDRRSSPCG